MFVPTFHDILYEFRILTRTRKLQHWKIWTWRFYQNNFLLTPPTIINIDTKFDLEKKKTFYRCLCHRKIFFYDFSILCVQVYRWKKKRSLSYRGAVYFFFPFCRGSNNCSSPLPPSIHSHRNCCIFFPGQSITILKFFLRFSKVPYIFLAKNGLVTVELYR